jgi:hypothetical protein
MTALGMLTLGTFIGWITSYALIHVNDWARPGNVLSAVISAAVAGAVFTFIQYLGGTTLGNALFYYPVGLAYGALCNSLGYIAGYPNIAGLPNGTLQALHILAFGMGSALLLALLLVPWIRGQLP